MHSPRNFNTCTTILESSTTSLKLHLFHFAILKNAKNFCIEGEKKIASKFINYNLSTQLIYNFFPPVSCFRCIVRDEKCQGKDQARKRKLLI